MEDQELQEIILKGIGGSPGICIGKAYLVDKEGVDVVKKYVVRKESLSAEVGRFKTAVKNAREELRRIIDDTPEAFRQHAQILRDPCAASGRQDDLRPDDRRDRK
jgi:phosphotransferase system enzyme I (PtsI)